MLNGKIYTIAGSKGDSIGGTEVEIYNPKTNSWSTLPNINIARVQNNAVIVDGRLYTFGGTTGQEDGILKSVEMYSLAISQPDPQQPEQPKGDRAILVITMTTGLEKEFDLSMD